MAPPSELACGVSKRATTNFANPSPWKVTCGIQAVAIEPPRVSAAKRVDTASIAPSRGSVALLSHRSRIIQARTTAIPSLGIDMSRRFDSERKIRRQAERLGTLARAASPGERIRARGKKKGGEEERLAESAVRADQVARDHRAHDLSHCEGGGHEGHEASRVHAAHALGLLHPDHRDHHERAAD